MVDAKFDELIRDYGFRVTPQRRVIMRAIWDNGEHAKIEEVLAAVRLEAPEMSQATVYRTLDLFIRHHLVLSSKFEGETVYEIASDHPHHHLICRNCLLDQKFEHSKFNDLIKEIDNEYHFMVESDHLILVGLCAYCQKELKKDDE